MQSSLKLTHFYCFMASFLMALAFASCGDSQKSEGDRELARVYDKMLFLSDMEGMLPEGISSEDSSIIIEQFVKTWTREAAMLKEAENNIPQDLNINKLVEDYKASLIKHNYEKILVERLLDSTVTAVELQEFYEKNREQYQLETPIIQCRFLKAPRNAPRINDVQKWWDSDEAADRELLKAWCSTNATVHNLQDSAWYKVVDIAAYLPQGTLTVDNVANKRDFTQRDDEFVYYFKVFSLVSKKEIAPLSYIEDQARKVILHKRKTQLLEETKDKLYQEAIRKNQIAVFE